jgi:hypothetical protein
MFKQGPVPAFVHGVIEYVAGVLFIAAPFLFGFSDDGDATAFFIVLGVLHLLLTIATRFIREARPPRRRPADTGPR